MDHFLRNQPCIFVLPVAQVIRIYPGKWKQKLNLWPEWILQQRE